MVQRNTTTLSLACALAISLATLPIAHAVTVLHNSTVVFNDDFENDPLNSEPINPEVGTWSGTSTFTHVETPATDVDPKHPATAFYGHQYLRLPRYTVGSGPYPGSGSNYTIGANLGSITSGTITATFALYVPSSDTDFPVGIAFSSANSFVGSLAWVDIMPQTDRHIYLNNSVSAVLIPGVTYETDVWQIWRMDYTILPGSNNDTWTVTIGGVTSAPIPATSAGDGSHDGPTTNINYFLFRGDNNGATVFVDGLPEPATLSLTAVGALLLLRRRKN